MNREVTHRRSTRLPPPVPRRGWAWFFDIDGTLLHITETPEQTRAGYDLLGRIIRLTRENGGAVALISGRSITDIDRIFHGHQFPAAGQHGAERRTVTGTISHSAPRSQLWNQVRDQLHALTRAHPGLQLEDKGLSLALHYRQAAPLASFAHQFMRQLGNELGEDYTVQRGKSVVELKPAGIDKGAAIRAFMTEHPFVDRTPVFLGDDLTDEYGFAAVNSFNGHSIKVGRGRTTARWYLPGVDAVVAWLSKLDHDPRT